VHRHGGLCRQQLDGHHHRGHRRAAEHGREAAHAHGACGVRRHRRRGPAQAVCRAWWPRPTRSGSAWSGRACTGSQRRSEPGGGGAERRGRQGGPRTPAPCWRSARPASSPHGSWPPPWVRWSRRRWLPASIPTRSPTAWPPPGRPVCGPHPLTVVGGLYLEGLLQTAPFRAALRRVVAVRPVMPTSACRSRSRRWTSSGSTLLRFGHTGSTPPSSDVLTATCALPPYFPSVISRRRAAGRRRGWRGPLPLAAVGDTEGLPVVAML